MLHFLLSSLGYKIQYICTFFALDADTSKILMFLPFNIPGFLLLMYYTSKIPSRIWVRMFIGFLTSNVIFGVLLGETTLFETFPFLMDCFLIPYVFGKYKFKCVKSKEILIMHTFLCAGKKET